MYEIFEKLLKEHNVSVYKVSKETGISNSTFSDWKNGISTPKTDKLSKIADYFGVSTDYLLGKDKPNTEITFDDFTYAMYDETKDLTEEDKEALLQMAKLLKKKIDKK